MRRRHWFVVSICALAVMLAGAPHSFGAGFALYEGSARGNALGNLAGSADDPSAMFMNPAGITQLPGLQVMAGATVISPMVDVQTTNPYGGNGNTESGERNYWIPPHLYASYQFNDSVWFGLATYSRFGLGTEFDDDWWGRYNNYNAVVQTLSFNPNVALKPKWNPILDLDLVRVARLLAQRRRIRTGRIMFFGIRPPYRKIGVDAVLFHEVLTIAWGKGYRAGEGSMLLEDNDLILRACEAMGGYLYKTWRIYETPIS